MRHSLKDCGKMEAEDMIHAHENIKGIDADLFTKSQKVSMKENLWKSRLCVIHLCIPSTQHDTWHVVGAQDTHVELFCC